MGRNYPLTGVTVLANTLVKRVLFSKKGKTSTATGIELANGTQYSVKREVIISAGAYRTLQLLLLSGIGACSDLTLHNISQVANSPSVGENL